MAKRIQQRRVDLGLSQRKLARRAGISVGTLNEIEGGIVDPKLSTILKLSAALLVSVDYLLDTEPLAA